VIESSTTTRTCPPHYWVITAGLPRSHMQVWTCRRCATRRDVPPPARGRAPQTLNRWRPGRPSRPVVGE